MENSYGKDMPIKDILEAWIRDIAKGIITEEIAKHQYMAKETESVFDIKKAAEYMRISVNTLYSYNQRKLIPSYKQGLKVYYKKEDLDNFLFNNNIRRKSQSEFGRDERAAILKKQKSRF